MVQRRGAPQRGRCRGELASSMATALKAVFWTFGGLLAVGTVLVLAFRQKPGPAGDTARWAVDQAETCWPRTRTKFNALDNSSKFWLGC